MPSGSQIINTESGSFGGSLSARSTTRSTPPRPSPGSTGTRRRSRARTSAPCAFSPPRARRAKAACPRKRRGSSPVCSRSPTRELNDFLLYPESPDNPLGALCGRVPAEDARALYRLCDTLVERAAALVAVNLCALLLKTGKGRDPRVPVCITVDGTTFWQLRSFRMRVESRMRGLLCGRAASARGKSPPWRTLRCWEPPSPH